MALLDFEPVIHISDKISFPDVDLHDFLKKFRTESNVYCKRIVLTVEESNVKDALFTLEQIAEKYNKQYGEPEIIYYAPDVLSITGKYFFVGVCIPDSDDPYTYDSFRSNPKQFNCELEFRVYGDRFTVAQIFCDIKERIIPSKIPTLTWEYMREGVRRIKNINLKNPKPIIDEFYPWLKGGVKEYQRKFLESESPILILLGEPGTGKTNFINDLIWDANISATFTYEEKLFHSDEMFVDFIMGRKELMILEDADILLLSREKDANEVMNKFLNIGDGLVNLGKKKIIFTANVTDKGKIDSALKRPGRCFDCVTFRKLTYDETVAACDAINIVAPDKVKEYSIAEMFGYNRGDIKREELKIGFVR